MQERKTDSKIERRMKGRYVSGDRRLNAGQKQERERIPYAVGRPDLRLS